MARLFGVDDEDVHVDSQSLRICGQEYPIDRGVILLDQTEVQDQAIPGTKEDVRRSFSHEWDLYRESLPEHDREFLSYFDVVQLDRLRDKLVIDLGCGSGRWSLRLAEYCDTIILVDFSDAIFVAAENLKDLPNAVFFRGDITQLPFVDGSADFFFSLGVLHHLEQSCLKSTRDLMRLGPEGLFYLYYALDNRPRYFGSILRGVTLLRKLAIRIRSEVIRGRISWIVARAVYSPMVLVGRIANYFGLRYPIPLYESYQGKSVGRMEQDAYDRFFTSIEQRVTKLEILDALTPEFHVRFSTSEPYWHFHVSRRHL